MPDIQRIESTREKKAEPNPDRSTHLQCALGRDGDLVVMETNRPASTGPSPHPASL